MLLMAGLMLADKTANFEDKLNQMQGTLSERKAELEGLRNMPASPPDRVEVPVIPVTVTDTLAELAARAESLAASVEEKVAG
jgi:cell division protein ZapA